MNSTPQYVLAGLLILGFSSMQGESPSDPGPVSPSRISYNTHLHAGWTMTWTDSRTDISRENWPSRLDSNSTLSLQGARSSRSAPAENPQQYSSDESSSTSSFLRPALFIGGAIAITGVLIRTDQQTYQTLYDLKQDHMAIRDVSPIITNLGDGRASFAIFGGFLAYSYIANDRTALQAGKIGLESFLLSGIAAQILKHTFGRERPSVATVSGGRWNGAFFLLNQGSGKRGGYAHFDAFPSGHTTTVFAAATTLAEVYHDSPWVSYASYSVASVVAVSRVMEQTHWVSDCFVGGLLGYFSTQLVLHLNQTGKPVALIPVSDGDNVGLALRVGF